MKKILLAGILLSVLLAAPGWARGRVGTGYMVGGTTRWDAMGKQSYISHGPLVYARWSIDLSYYLDLDFGAEWRHQFMKMPSGNTHPVSGFPSGEMFNEEYITVSMTPSPGYWPFRR